MVPTLLWVLKVAAFAAVGAVEAAYEPEIVPTVWVSAGGGFTYRTAPGLVRISALPEKGPVDVDWGKTRLRLIDGARVALWSDGHVEAETVGVVLAGGAELGVGESLAVRSRFTLLDEERAEMRMAVRQAPPAPRPAAPPFFAVEGVPPAGLQVGEAEPGKPPRLTRWQWVPAGLVTAAALLIAVELWRMRTTG